MKYLLLVQPYIFSPMIGKILLLNPVIFVELGAVYLQLIKSYGLLYVPHHLQQEIHIMITKQAMG